MKELLKLREARETGICLKREDLYNQCLDELIRQITINCSHRGLLLVRIRDELKMNIESYRNLYESVLAYGMRKAMLGQKTKNEQKNIFDGFPDTNGAKRLRTRVRGMGTKISRKPSQHLTICVCWHT